MDNSEAAAREFQRLIEIIASLRGPQGCPWDREQTHASLKPYLIEEAHEVCDAIDGGTPEQLRDELGDLLMQPILHAQLAAEAGTFDLAEVLRSINDKLVRRHPHVFGDVKAETPAQVLRNWEQIKQQEQFEAGETARPRSLMDGIPHSLPALYRAQRIQDKFARVGFDWPSVDGALAKVREELDELLALIPTRDRDNAPALEEELGDLLFAVVNVARLLQLDAEQALKAACTKTASRFCGIEAAARAEGREVRELSLAEMDEIWEAGKTGEGVKG